MPMLLATLLDLLLLAVAAAAPAVPLEAAAAPLAADGLLLKPGETQRVELDSAGDWVPLDLDLSETAVTFHARSPALDVAVRFYKANGKLAGTREDLTSLDEVWVTLDKGGLARLEVRATAGGTGVVELQLEVGKQALPTVVGQPRLHAERLRARGHERLQRDHPHGLRDLIDAALLFVSLNRTGAAGALLDEIEPLLDARARAQSAAGGPSYETRRWLATALGVGVRVAVQRADFAEAARTLELMRQAAEGLGDAGLDLQLRRLEADLLVYEGRPAQALELKLELLRALDERPLAEDAERTRREIQRLRLAAEVRDLAVASGRPADGELVWQAALQRAQAQPAAIRDGLQLTLATLRASRDDTPISPGDLTRLDEASRGGDDETPDTVWYALARDAARAGRLLEAELLLQAALERAARRGHVFNELVSLHRLAQLALARGDREAARAWFLVSLERRPGLSPGSELGFERALLDVALDAGAAGVSERLTAALDWAETRDNVDRSLELLELLLMDAHEGGEFERALQLAQRHEALAREHAREARVAISRSNLADTHRRLGQSDAARAVALAGLELDDEGLPWDVRLAVAGSAVRAALSADDRATAELAFAHGLELLERVPVAEDPTRLAMRRAHRSVSAWVPLAVDMLAASSAAARGDAERRRALELGYVRHGALKVRALLEGLAGPELAARGVAPAELAALLGEDELFVEYLAGSEQLHALVITSERQWLLPLGGRASLEDLVAGYVDGLARSDPLMTWSDVTLLGGALGERLLRPVLASCGPGLHRRLIVAPSGRLASLPWEALVLEVRAPVEGAEQLTFVADEFVVLHVPSGAVYAVLDAARPMATPVAGGAGRLLAVADPVYGPAPGAVAGGAAGALASAAAARSQDLSRLVASRDEVLGIAGLLLRRTRPDESAPLPELARDDRFELPECAVLLGAEATRAALTEALGDASLLHIAAHGLVDASDPRRTGLVLTGGELLSVPDILQLQLRADLAVLSACSTARGAVYAGEGVQSLGLAFLRAGARSVVASAWQVDDASTAVLMGRFYELLLEGQLAVPEALAAARRELRLGLHASSGRPRGKLLPAAARRLEEEWKRAAGHPHHWAPFLVVGR